MSRRVVVTGANRGIGFAIAKHFSTKGDSVVALCRSSSIVLDRVAESIVIADFSDLDSIDRICEQLGDVDVLVNNAGFQNGHGLDQYDCNSMKQIFSVNLWFPVILTHRLVKSLSRNRNGRVVMNTSIAGQIGHPDVWYGASKAGLINATKSLARSYGGLGVSINAIAAGPTETDMMEQIPLSRREALKAAAISGRFAMPSEVASVVYWLATECPDYVNGSTIDVNNGMFMR
ncbi:MAG: SDR family oxidoreductase [Pirellulaceae bacterium]|nr:SDR family oxidoreductase [Pirellulaceae bacterium]